MDMFSLEVKDLKKSYRRHFYSHPVDVLKGVSFFIRPGEITGFLGANGAGKTTTLKCILGLAHPTSGNISFFGGEKNFKKVRSKIGFLPERPYFYSYLTGKEFLKFYAQLTLNLPSKELNFRITEILERVKLKDVEEKPLGEFSKGMLQKIGIAQALLHRPELVILDEPMSGLDPDGRLALSKIIQETSEMGAAVFFSSHLLHDAEKLCKNLVILKEGSVFYEGSTLDLIRSMELGYRITFEDFRGSESKLESSFKLGGVLSEPDLSPFDESKNTLSIKTKEVPSREQLQKEIDSLRSYKKNIISIESLRPSLEEYFVRQVL